MRNKMIRAVVAILLVCILIFNITPIRAQAVGVDQFIGVAINKVGLYAQAGALSTGAAAFAWVLVGLGIVATAAQTIELMNEYTEYSGEMETSIYYYPDGSWSYGVDMGFVERVRAFLWDNGVFELSVPIPDSADVSNYDGLAAAVDAFRNYPYALVVYHDSVLWTVCGSDVPCSFSKTSDGNYYVFKTEDRSNSIRFTKTYSAGETSHLDWNVVTVTSFCRFGTANSTDTDFDIVSDYELGQVAPLTVPMPESYPEWITNARPATNPDTDEEITVLPIPFNPSADPETQIGTLTQPEIWEGSIADPMPEFPETGTGSDATVSSTPWETFKKWIFEGWNKIITAIPSAQTIAQSIGNVFRELFVPSPDTIAQKVGEMRDSFPFIDGIISTGEAIRDGLSYDIAPPEIWIDLGEATTDTFGHKKYLITDFAWYAPYKPRVDALLSAALWAFFSWRVFVRLPSIIGGEGGQIESYASHMHALDMKNAEPEGKKRRGKK